jgi:hypothetical protein
VSADSSTFGSERFDYTIHGPHAEAFVSVEGRLDGLPGEHACEKSHGGGRPPARQSLGGLPESSQIHPCHDYVCCAFWAIRAAQDLNLYAE